jgi:hypothetical protein
MRGRSIFDLGCRTALIMARVAVSVLHWGEPARTLRCLASVRASDLQPEWVFVLDNGTGSLSATEVEATVPGAIFIPLPENVGFTTGHNLLIRRALALGATHVLLLNNDAVLDPACVSSLVEVARAPRVAAVGAKIMADPGRLWMAWGRVTWRAALVKPVGHGLPDGPPFNQVRDVEWVSGCAMLLSREALEEIGPLDERYFAYHEDADWCTTARDRGYRVRFAPSARVIHEGEGCQTNNGGPHPARYLSARNTVLFARKHGRLHEQLLLAGCILWSLPIAALRAWSRGDGADVSMLWRGYRDGVLARDLPLVALGLRRASPSPHAAGSRDRELNVRDAEHELARVASD